MGHRPDVEGLRAVALLLVVAFHAGIGVLSGGFVGVDVFFVLSGFLITGLLADELVSSGRVSFLRFYGRRARRLLPMATVVLLATAAAFAAVVSPLDRGGVVADVRAAALYIANWHFAGSSLDYMSSTDKSPVLHYWSLSVEEQFYFVWPLVLVLVAGRLHRRGRCRSHPVRRMFAALAIIGAVSLLASVLLTSASPAYSYYGLHTRAWELAAGGLLALAARPLGRVPMTMRYVAGWVGLAGVVASGFVISTSTTFPGVAAALPVGATMLLVAAGGPSAGGASRLLSAAPLTYVGRLSYAWYLWHWPCLVLAATLAGNVGTGDAAAGFQPARGWVALAAVAVSFVLSVFSHHMLEDPVRRSAWLAAVRHRSIALAAALTTASVTLVAVVLPSSGIVAAGPITTLTAGSDSPDATGGSPTVAQVRTVSLTMTPRQARYDLPKDARDCAANKTATRPAPDCQFGDPHGTKVLVVVGDSHAYRLLPALEVIGAQRHWKVWLWTKSGCAFIPLTVRLAQQGNAYPSCGVWRNNILRKLASMGRIDAVMVAHYSLYAYHLGTADNHPLTYEQAVQAWGPAWATMSQRLHRVTRRVLMLHDNPVAPWDVPACLAQHLSRVSACTFPHARAFRDVDALYNAERASGSNTRFVDLDDVLCPGRTCPVISYRGAIIYSDWHHLTATMSRSLGGLLGKRIAAQLAS